MNGEPLPIQHGYPVRLVVPGWYAVASVIWLTEIELIGRPFAGRYEANKYWYERERAGQTLREPVTLKRCGLRSPSLRQIGRSGAVNCICNRLMADAKRTVVIPVRAALYWVDMRRCLRRIRAIKCLIRRSASLCPALCKPYPSVPGTAAHTSGATVCAPCHTRHYSPGLYRSSSLSVTPLVHPKPSCNGYSPPPPPPVPAPSTTYFSTSFLSDA
jgi:hypothetical protein